MADEGSGQKVTGRVVRVIGPVVDVDFPPDRLPEINTALEIDRTLDGEISTIVCEVAQHIGDSTVRTIAMRPTDGLVRGAPVRNIGGPLTPALGPAPPGPGLNRLGGAPDTDRGHAADGSPL